MNVAAGIGMVAFLTILGHVLPAAAAFRLSGPVYLVAEDVRVGLVKPFLTVTLRPEAG